MSTFVDFLDENSCGNPSVGISNEHTWQVFVKKLTNIFMDTSII